ncbi:MAG: hypothetical protein U9R46_09935 [Bacteroidota bacterium]|nr:hypothetical protein [Bacteroidota bacterium]
MANFSLRYYKQFVVIPIVGIATLATSFVSHFVHNHWGIALSAFALAGGLFAVIDLWLWCVWPIKYLYQMKDFRGHYEGTLVFERRDERGELIKGSMRHEKILTQTGSGVAIRSKTFKEDGSLSSESLSNVESIEIDKDGTFKLIFTYLNNGSVNNGFPPHYGTEVMIFSDKDEVKRLTGIYYTNRLPMQTRGEIDVVLKKPIKK